MTDLTSSVTPTSALDLTHASCQALDERLNLQWHAVLREIPRRLDDRSHQNHHRSSLLHRAHASCSHVGDNLPPRASYNAAHADNQQSAIMAPDFAIRSPSLHVFTVISNTEWFPARLADDNDSAALKSTAACGSSVVVAEMADSDHLCGRSGQ